MNDFTGRQRSAVDFAPVADLDKPYKEPKRPSQGRTEIVSYERMKAEQLRWRDLAYGYGVSRRSIAIDDAFGSHGRTRNGQAMIERMEHMQQISDLISARRDKYFLETISGLSVMPAPKSLGRDVTLKKNGKIVATLFAPVGTTATDLMSKTMGLEFPDLFWWNCSDKAPNRLEAARDIRANLKWSADYFRTFKDYDFLLELVTAICATEPDEIDVSTRWLDSVACIS